MRARGPPCKAYVDSERPAPELLLRRRRFPPRRLAVRAELRLGKLGALLDFDVARGPRDPLVPAPLAPVPGDLEGDLCHAAHPTHPLCPCQGVPVKLT